MAHRIACLSFALCVLLAPALVAAGEGQVVILPKGAGPPKHGIRLTIDDTWVHGSGYRPIRIQIENWPLGPATADRKIYIEYSGPSNRGSTPDTVTQTFTLPEGQASTIVTFAVPEAAEYYWRDWKVWVDDDFARDLSTQTMNGGMTFRGGQADEAAHRVLVVARNAPDPQQRQALLLLASNKRPALDLPDLRGPIDLANGTGQFPQTSSTDPYDQLTMVQNNALIELLPPSLLPDRWVGLSMIDSLFISIDDLTLVSQQHPAQFQAIRDWLSTGPTLAVFNLGEKNKRLPELEKLLGLPTEPAGDPLRRRWETRRERAAKVRSASNTSRHERDGVRYLADLREEEPAISEEPKPELTEDRPADAEDLEWLFQSVDMGTVVALSDAAPLMGGRLNSYDYLKNCLPRNQTSGIARTGVSMLEGSPLYNGLNIPGVGGAPTNTFRVLITLFVIFIGPVCYFFFLRMGRLYLMLVAVPTGAAVVTISLFAYALIADGLGTRVRMRSYTWLDQRTGQAVVYARQTYYAGLAPSQGLVFSADTMILPIDPQDYYYRPSYNRRLAWEEDQRLAEGYFPSRVHAQFMAIRATQTKAGLKITPGAEGSNTLVVENGLDTAIEALVLRDTDGKCYSVAPSIPAGGQATAVWKATDLALNDFARVMVNAELRTPIDQPYPPYRINSYKSVPSSYNGGEYVGLLGERFGMVRWRVSEHLPPRHFRALITTSPVAPLAAEGEEIGSVHMLEGTW